MRVADCSDIRQISHAPRLFEVLRKMRDQELLSGKNVCRDHKTPCLNQRGIRRRLVRTLRNDIFGTRHIENQ